MNPSSPDNTDPDAAGYASNPHARSGPFYERLKKTAIITCLILFASCESTGPAVYREIPTTSENAINVIESKISAGLYGDAIEEILRRMVDSAVDRTKLDSLYSDAVGRLDASFKASLESGDAVTALSRYRSLAALGEGARAGTVTEPQLRLRTAVKYLDEKKIPAALQILQKLSLSEEAFGSLPDDTLTAFGNAAYRNNYRQVLAGIAELVKKRSIPEPEEWKTVLEGKHSTSDIIKGTATVFVNRGMKIRGGVGYLDRALGSAFYIDSEGYLLTNYHVISSEVDPTYEGYSRLYIIPAGSKDRIPARVVGYDRVFDVALLKVDLTAPYVFPILADVEVKPGDPIIAIGSPVGLESTVSSGILSAVERRLLQTGDVFQIDVPVNPGNSGGPLLDKNGSLIGIVFAGLEQYQGLNFAIPISWVGGLIPSLMKGGEAVHSWFGISLVETVYGLKTIYSVPGAVGARSGIVAGDIIRSINGTRMNSLRDAQKTLLDYSPDTLLTVEYERNGNVHRAILSCGIRPYRPIETALDRDLMQNVFPPLFGMSVRRTDRLSWSAEYVVEDVYQGMIADEIGLQPGDPFMIRLWKVDRKLGYAALDLYIRKRKAGFVESSILLSTYIETDNFL